MRRRSARQSSSLGRGAGALSARPPPAGACLEDRGEGPSHGRRRLRTLLALAQSSPEGFEERRRRWRLLLELLAATWDERIEEPVAAGALAGFACLTQDVAALGHLALEESDWLWGDEDRYLPLHNAVYSGRLDILRAALARGAPVDARGAGGATALMVAAENATVEGDELVEELLRAGADPRLEDEDEAGRAVLERVPRRGCPPAAWNALVSAFDGRLDRPGSNVVSLRRGPPRDSGHEP